MTTRPRRVFATCCLAASLGWVLVLVHSAAAGNPPPPPPESTGEWVLKESAPAALGSEYAIFRSPAVPDGECLGVDVLVGGIAPDPDAPRGFEVCFDGTLLASLPQGVAGFLGFDIGTLEGIKVLVMLVPEAGYRLVGKVTPAASRSAVAGQQRVAVLVYADDEELTKVVVKSETGRRTGVCRVNEDGLHVRCKRA